MRESGRGSFEEWARSRQQALVRTAYLVTGDHHRAEDLVQEALVGVAMRWDRLRDGNPDAWVRTVVYRGNVSWWRRHRREVAAERLPERSTAGPGETRMLVEDALDGLTPKQRAVLLLRFLEDLSVEETARVVELRSGAVKTRCHRALKTLRRRLTTIEEEAS